MDWSSLLISAPTAIIAAVLTYFFGLAKDRSNALHAKKIEVMVQLHEQVLKMDKMAFPDGKSVLVDMEGGTEHQTGLLKDKEFNEFNDFIIWKEKELISETDKARLWLHRRTVDIVGDYFILMLICATWKNIGKGLLIEDKELIYFLKNIFGNIKPVLNKVVRRHSKTGQPLHLYRDRLSNMCLEVVQQYMHLELSASNFRFRLKSFCQQRSYLPNF